MASRRLLLRLLGLLSSSIVIDIPAASAWTHSWASTSASTFADFNANKILTDKEIAFVAAKYRVVSLEKCTGVASGLKTEEAIYGTAQRLKKANPAIKVIFYLATDQQGLQCYAANDAFSANPSWWLKDDAGKVVQSNNHPVLDVTSPAGRAWYTGIPYGGVNGTGMFNGVPVSTLIDGVLSDGAGWSNYKGIAMARLKRLADAKRTMLSELQAALTKANPDAIVMANGINNYPAPNADPRDPHNLGVLDHVSAIMNEHTAVFESVNRANASFNMARVAANLDAVEAAAAAHNGSKTVFLQTWPGLYTTTGFLDGTVFPPVANGGEPSPTNVSMWRAALREHFAFAQALFLTVAAPNIFWFYGGYWYPSTTGIVACPDDPASCPAPPEWYPDLDKDLGKPLGARKPVGPYAWEREFEHASVHLDLFRPKASKVTFKQDNLQSGGRSSSSFVTDAILARDAGGGGNDAPVSMWNPSIVVTGSGKVLLFAQADVDNGQPGGRTSAVNTFASSSDFGHTWSNLTVFGPPGAACALYSPTTGGPSGTTFLFAKSPNMIDNGTRPDPPGGGGALFMSATTDDGQSWSEPAPLNVTNAFAPHYGGGGRTHGIELQRGPHKGRFILPRIGTPAGQPPRGQNVIHSFALYSDDAGRTWTAGATLPNQWDECTLQELKNGSVLMSARIDDPENTDRHHPDTNRTRVRTTRGFAISHDGGSTWDRQWTMFERQPEIHDAPCSDALAYSLESDSLYFGHPGSVNGSRTNYTILRSTDSGLSWNFVDRVYPAGAGYSDMVVLPPSAHGGAQTGGTEAAGTEIAGDVLGIAFQRTLWEPGVEGGGYNMGWATWYVDA